MTSVLQCRIYMHWRLTDSKRSKSGQALYLRLPLVQELLLDKATAKIDKACELADNNWLVWGAPLKVVILLLLD